jgi:serine/threonine-protein kinase
MEGLPPVNIEKSTLAPGDVLGRHELLMPIAKGGMGQVWAARLHGTRGFQKLVAVKTILPSGEDAGNLEAMLFEEASLAALVRHQNVVETLDLGERQDGTMYLVMEWVSGEPLDHILRAAEAVGGVPTAMVVHFAIQALSGLRAVHETRNARGEPLGIVHRDVSPQNLLVTYGGVVKLIDFGIAKATQQMSRPTEEGMVKGKFAYMSPEQLRSEPVDPRADLFSMGVILYRATTGVHPFQSDNLAATIRNILMSEPKKPSALVPGYPALLEQVVLKALSKESSERFGSAQEMLHALEHAFPEARASGMDKQCEAFLQQLFHERMAERTRALQVAMKAADEAKAAKTGDPELRIRSQSTMRAVSREMVTAASERPAGPEPDSSEIESPVLSGRPRRRAIAAVGTALGIGVLLLAGFVGSRKSISSQAGQARGAVNVAEESRNVRVAPSVSADLSRGALAPTPQSALPAAPSSSGGWYAPAPPSSSNPSRPVSGPKRRAHQIGEPGPVSPATDAAPPPPSVAPPAPIDVDPLSRRR